MTERNPYLLLGIPFGSSRASANIAFARKSRELRRAGERSGVRMTDLTWALNQIDEAMADPDAALHVYRVPADPATFSRGGGVLSPKPEVLPSRGGDTEAAFRMAHETAVHDYLRYLVAARAAGIALPEA